VGLFLIWCVREKRGGGRDLEGGHLPSTARKGRGSDFALTGKPGRSGMPVVLFDHLKEEKGEDQSRGKGTDIGISKVSSRLTGRY